MKAIFFPSFKGMSTLLPFNATSQYTPYGVVNQGFDFLTVVKQWITEHIEQMKTKGLKEVYINETDILPAVILTLKSDYKDDDKYWRNAREDIRKCGAEYVSNIYENDDLFDIDEDYKKFI
jgi:hypothetical protein